MGTCQRALKPASSMVTRTSSTDSLTAALPKASTLATSPAPNHNAAADSRMNAAKGHCLRRMQRVPGVQRCDPHLLSHHPAHRRDSPVARDHTSSVTRGERVSEAHLTQPRHSVSVHAHGRVERPSLWPATNQHVRQHISVWELCGRLRSKRVGLPIERVSAGLPPFHNCSTVSNPFDICFVPACSPLRCPSRALWTQTHVLRLSNQPGSSPQLSPAKPAQGPGVSAQGPGVSAPGPGVSAPGPGVSAEPLPAGCSPVGG